MTTGISWPGSEPSSDVFKASKKNKNCKQAKHPKRCRLKKKLDPGQTLDDLLDELGEQLDEIQDPLDDIIDGGLLP